jgi:hypothetical protein
MSFTFYKIMRSASQINAMFKSLVILLLIINFIFFNTIIRFFFFFFEDTVSTYFYSFAKRRPLQITFIAIELNQ